MIQFNKELSIIEILEADDKTLFANINRLAVEYLKEAGRKVCKTCPASVRLMILTLKHIYKMEQFKFKKPKAQYKNKKGDSVTISNSTMTDEKAIEFLKTNPERISLFSDYPENWKELLTIGIVEETAEELEVRLAIEAEMKEVNNGKVSKPKPEPEPETESDIEKEARLAAENTVSDEPLVDFKELTREDLMRIPLKDLRLKYPDIRATSVSAFVDQVLA